MELAITFNSNWKTANEKQQLKNSNWKPAIEKQQLKNGNWKAVNEILPRKESQNQA